MSYFSDNATVKVTLPSNDKYWVVLATDFKYGDIKKFAAINSDGQVDFAAAGDLFLQTAIKEWNLDDGNGIAEITPENIDKLTKDDAVFLIEQASGTIEEDPKKNVTSSES